MYFKYYFVSTRLSRDTVPGTLIQQNVRNFLFPPLYSSFYHPAMGLESAQVKIEGSIAKVTKRPRWRSFKNILLPVISNSFGKNTVGCIHFELIPMKNSASKYL